MVLQTEIRNLLRSDVHNYEVSQRLNELALTVERTDSFTDLFRDAWNRIRGQLGIVGSATSVHNANAVESLTGHRTPDVGAALIETFQNSTIGYARSILREQILAAREILDTPETSLAVINKREAILKTFDVYENRMRFTATNELLQLNADINKSRQTLAGIRQYVWTTCLDDRVRPTHQALEGQICDWISPPPPGFAPGEDYNCRCAAFPVVDDTYILVARQALDR